MATYLRIINVLPLTAACVLILVVLDLTTDRQTIYSHTVPTPTFHCCLLIGTSIGTVYVTTLATTVHHVCCDYWSKSNWTVTALAWPAPPSASDARTGWGWPRETMLKYELGILHIKTSLAASIRRYIKPGFYRCPAEACLKKISQLAPFTGFLQHNIHFFFRHVQNRNHIQLYGLGMRIPCMGRLSGCQ